MRIKSKAPAFEDRRLGHPPLQNRSKPGPPAQAPSGQLSLIFASGEDSLSRFWQRRFYDFNVWSLKKRVEKLHYMHMNPLKRKLVDHPRDWPWSSFSFYSNPNNGLIRVDPIR